MQPAWDPYYQNHLQLLEKVQRRAKRYSSVTTTYAPTFRLAHTITESPARDE